MTFSPSKLEAVVLALRKRLKVTLRDLECPVAQRGGGFAALDAAERQAHEPPARLRVADLARLTCHENGPAPGQRLLRRERFDLESAPHAPGA